MDWGEGGGVVRCSVSSDVGEGGGLPQLFHVLLIPVVSEERLAGKETDGGLAVG